MKWYQKSYTVIGVIIGGLTALGDTLNVIGPELEKLGAVSAISAVIVGIRRSLERLRPKDGE